MILLFKLNFFIVFLTENWEVFCVLSCLWKYFRLVFFLSFIKPFEALFRFKSQSMLRVFIAFGAQMKVACCDIVYVADVTTYHVLRVMWSIWSLRYQRAFDRNSWLFFVGFSGLWAPSERMTTLIIITDPKKNLIFALQFLLWISRILWTFQLPAGLHLITPPDAKKILLKWKNVLLSFMRKTKLKSWRPNLTRKKVTTAASESLCLFRFRFEQFLKDNTVSSRDVHRNITSLKKLQEDEQSNQSNQSKQMSSGVPHCRTSMLRGYQLWPPHCCWVQPVSRSPRNTYETNRSFT